MTGFKPASRSITDVKVDHTRIGETMAPKFRLSWMDGAGERHEIERFGHAAVAFITDLHAYTLAGEGPRAAYLIGFIRCHSLRRGDGG